MHLKRQNIPKNWPMKKKGTAYVVQPKANLGKGIPVLVILRDVLGLAQNRKEVKRAIHLKQLLLNSKRVTDEKNTALLFDTLTLLPTQKGKEGKSYRLELSEKGKFDLREIDEKEAGQKVSKIIDKKVLNGKKTQLNLSDGNNFLSSIKCEVNDSVLVNFKDKKIEKCLPLKENSEVIVFSGKHSGEKGTIQKIDKEKKMVYLKTKDKEFHVLIKQIMVLK